MKKILIIIIALFITFSCKTSEKKQMEQIRLSQLQKQNEVVPEEVILKAYAKKNKVYVILKNNLKKDLNITPLNFGIIKDKKLTKYEHGKALCEFPAGVLKPKMEFNGWFTFYNFGDLTGSRLVFNNPDHEPIFTVIEQYTQ